MKSKVILNPQDYYRVKNKSSASAASFEKLLSQQKCH